MTEATKERVKHELCRMDATGDTKIEWFPDDADEIKQAKAEFDRLQKEGWTFYAIGKLGGKTDKKITKFDSTLARIIAIPQFKGG